MKKPTNGQPFRLDHFDIHIHGDGTCPPLVQAMVTIEADGRRKTIAVEDNASPAAVLQKAMREALSDLYQVNLAPVATPDEGWGNEIEQVRAVLVNGFTYQLRGGEYGQGD